MYLKQLSDLDLSAQSPVSYQNPRLYVFCKTVLFKFVGNIVKKLFNNMDQTNPTGTWHRLIPTVRALFGDDVLILIDLTALWAKPSIQ